MTEHPPRIETVQTELLETIRRLQAGEITPKEANAIARRVGAELKVVETAIRAERQRRRISPP